MRSTPTDGPYFCMIHKSYFCICNRTTKPLATVTSLTEYRERRRNDEDEDA
jgi:hypothetical protein